MSRFYRRDYAPSWGGYLHLFVDPNRNWNDNWMLRFRVGDHVVRARGKQMVHFALLDGDE